MNVLVACEFSGVVRDAFCNAGHEAYSCDLLPSEGQFRRNHIKADAVETASNGYWDLMIAHPPCTYLARSGARWWSERRLEQQDALAFVRNLLAAPIPHIALENPPGRIGTQIRKADQYIQPWQFGHGETKMTGLWLKDLPRLQPTEIVPGREPRTHYAAPGPERWKERSRTLPGIAKAMAVQWGRLALNQSGNSQC